MCSTILLNSLKIINKNPIAFQYGKRILVTEVHRQVKTTKASRTLFNSRAINFNKLLPQTIQTSILTHRVYSDFPQNAETKEKSQDIVENTKTETGNIHDLRLENAIAEQPVKETLNNVSIDVKKQQSGQAQGSPSKIRLYYLEFERLLYLFLAGSLDAFYAILASNELKLIKLSVLRAYNWLRASFQKHIMENPKVQNKLNEIKANVEKARREDLNKS